jgi:probable HAF family extracellular repeat protein
VLWNGATHTDLGTLGGSNSVGYGINASGQVAGYSQVAGDGAYHAVRWNGTTPTDLGTLDGGSDSRAYGINASGQVAGEGRSSNGYRHAVLWNGTTPTDLGTLGGTEAYGYAINSTGDVIGMSYTVGDVAFNAFLYTGGTMYDLNDLLVTGSGVSGLSVSPGGINDLGQIAATGTVGGQTHALRLDPFVDTDGDGIPDQYETGTGIYVSPTDTGTSPTNSDTDGDGLNDGLEVFTYHCNPNIPDTDGDGFDDGFEVSTGFSPTSPASTPEALSSIRVAAEYRFNAANGISYRIEASTDLATWTTIETNHRQRRRHHEVLLGGRAGATLLPIAAELTSQNALHKSNPSLKDGKTVKGILPFRAPRSL